MHSSGDKKDREVVDAIGRKSFDEWTSADKLALFGIAVIATQSPPSARNAIIEECAKVIDARVAADGRKTAEDYEAIACAKAIRALSDGSADVGASGQGGSSN